MKFGGILLAALLQLLGLVGILLFTAAFTLLERKLMGLHQRREGPDRVGFEGVGQPFADGLKLLRKETLRPKDTPEGRVFLLAPLLSLWVSLLLWAFVPFSAAGALCGEEVGLLLVLGLSSLGSYGVIYAGWASNNKYALLGAFRAVAQFISYEILFSLLFLPLVATTASLNLVTLVEYQAVEGWFAYLLPLWLLAFPVVLAETNRTPFDLPEAEAELVAGFNVEYSSLLFAFFFLAEYSAMGFFGALLATLFFGGWSLRPWGAAPVPALGAGGGPEFTPAQWAETLGGALPTLRPAEGALLVLGGQVVVLALKVQLLCGCFILVRAALPRLRFDQLLALCWKFLFPLVVALVVALVGLDYASLQLFLGLEGLEGGGEPAAVALVAATAGGSGSGADDPSDARGRQNAELLLTYAAALHLYTGLAWLRGNQLLHQLQTGEAPPSTPTLPSCEELEQWSAGAGAMVGICLEAGALEFLSSDQEIELSNLLKRVREDRAAAPERHREMLFRQEVAVEHCGSQLAVAQALLQALATYENCQSIRFLVLGNLAEALATGPFRSFGVGSPPPPPSTVPLSLPFPPLSPPIPTSPTRHASA